MLLTYTFILCLISIVFILYNKQSKNTDKISTLLQGVIIIFIIMATFMLYFVVGTPSQNDGDSLTKQTSDNYSKELDAFETSFLRNLKNNVEPKENLYKISVLYSKLKAKRKNYVIFIINMKNLLMEE